MRIRVIAYVTVLIVMGVLDGVWLSFAVSRVYRPGIGHLMADRPHWEPALAFYLLYAAGITYLVTLPALDADPMWSPMVGATRGAVLGLVAYGTYDLTSLAILRGWPVGVTVIDMVWGAVITGVSAGAAVWVAGRFG